MPPDQWPVIDSGTLTQAQRRGRRCVVPNCRRRWPDQQVAQLPSGQPLYACTDCAANLTLERAA